MIGNTQSDELLNLKSRVSSSILVLGKFHGLDIRPSLDRGHMVSLCPVLCFVLDVGSRVSVIWAKE